MPQCNRWRETLGDDTSAAVKFACGVGVQMRLDVRFKAIVAGAEKCRSN